MRIFSMTLVMNHTLFNYIVPSDSTVAVYFVRYSEWVFECECNCLEKSYGPVPLARRLKGRTA